MASVFNTQHFHHKIKYIANHYHFDVSFDLKSHVSMLNCPLDMRDTRSFKHSIMIKTRRYSVKQITWNMK